GCCCSKSSRPLIGRILEDAPDSRPIPGGFPFGRHDSCLLQASPDFAQADTLHSHPPEYLPHGLGLLCNHLILRPAASLLFANVTIAKGCPGENPPFPGLSGMTLAASTAFQNLSSLILGDHPLHL